MNVYPASFASQSGPNVGHFFVRVGAHMHSVRVTMYLRRGTSVEKNGERLYSTTEGTTTITRG